MPAKSIPVHKLTKEHHSDPPFKAEELQANSGYNPMAPHRHNYYEIFLFEEGGGLHMIDFHETKIVKGELHILSPGQVHYMQRKPKSRGWVLKFTSEFFLSNTDNNMLQRIPFLNNKVAEPLIRPDKEQFNSLLQLVTEIREEAEVQHTGYMDMIRNYLNLILLKCHRMYDYTTPSVNSPEGMLCDAFKTMLEHHYLEESGVAFYCGKLNVSSDKLSHAVKKTTGTSSGEVIAARMLLEAKRLLLHSQKSMKEVAFSLNFNDNAYFTRWFKNLEGCSPGEFRTVNREKYTGG